MAGSDPINEVSPRLGMTDSEKEMVVTGQIYGLLQTLKPEARLRVYAGAGCVAGLVPTDVMVRLIARVIGGSEDV
jgi:hypothetical protein